jgi:hypothetical protein
MRTKYVAGQQEHGGELWRKPILGELLEETIDLAVYAETLSDQMQAGLSLLRHAIQERDWALVTVALETLNPPPSSKPDPATAFQNLAKSANGHWDGVDAVEYVKQVRG